MFCSGLLIGGASKYRMFRKSKELKYSGKLKKLTQNGAMGKIVNIRQIHKVVKKAKNWNLVIDTEWENW